MNKGAIVTSNGVELIYSNRICCFNNEQMDIRIKLTDKKEDELKLKFLFNYPSDSQSGIKIETNKKNEIVIELINFNSPFGTGLKRPIRIATLNGRTIYAIFSVEKPNESNPIMDLSLYMESSDGR